MNDLATDRKEAIAAPVVAQAFWRPYVQLTKPGIVIGNLISVVGGYTFATQGRFELLAFIIALLGVSTVVAAGCVFNNYIDRDIDAKMHRTRNRPFVQGLVSPAAALTMGSILLAAGLAILATANWLSAFLAATGFIIYVVIYSLWIKRASSWATFVGSFAGAMPPVIGYCVAQGQFNHETWFLLAMYSLWQLPHSHAIAIMNYKDNVAAKLPALAICKGIETTKRHILIEILLFSLIVFLPALWAKTTVLYTCLALASGFGWLVWALYSQHSRENPKWARGVFIYSILSVTIMSFALQFVERL